MHVTRSAATQACLECSRELDWIGDLKQIAMDVFGLISLK
jgi:hypothetical protein